MDLKRFGVGEQRTGSHGQNFRKEKGASDSGEEGTGALDLTVTEFGGRGGGESVYRRWGLWI